MTTIIITRTRSRYQRAALLLRKHAPAHTRDAAKQTAAAKSMIRASTGKSSAPAPAARSVPITYPANDHLNPVSQEKETVFRWFCFIQSLCVPISESQAKNPVFSTILTKRIPLNTGMPPKSNKKYVEK